MWYLRDRKSSVGTQCRGEIAEGPKAAVAWVAVKGGVAFHSAYRGNIPSPSF